MKKIGHAEFTTSAQMMLQKLEDQFHCKSENFTLFFWRQCFGKDKSSARGSSQRTKVCFYTVNFIQTQKDYLSENQTTTGTEPAPITSTEKP